MTKEKVYNIPNSLNFLHDIFGNNDADFLDYLSNMLRHPEKYLPNILLVGPPACGKTVFLNWMGRLFGDVSASISCSDINNPSLYAESRLILIDEVNKDFYNEKIKIVECLANKPMVINKQCQPIKTIKFNGIFFMASNIPSPVSNRTWHIIVPPIDFIGKHTPFLRQMLMNEEKEFKSYILNRGINNQWGQIYS